MSVDRELREPCVSEIRQGHWCGLLVGKPARHAVSDGPAERKFVEEAVLVVAPRIEAHAADTFRHTRGVIERIALAVEGARPILERTAFNVAVQYGAGAAESGCSRRIQQGLQAAIQEVNVGDARGQFLGERLLELPGLQ